MRQVDVARLLESVAALSSEEERTRRIHQEAQTFLRAPAGVAELLQAALRTGEGTRSDVACALLAVALDAARMAVENSSPAGPPLLHAAETALREMDTAGSLNASGRIRIAQIYARAELDPPPEAMLTLDVLADAVPPGGRQLPDVGAMLEGIYREVDQELLQAHGMLGESLAALPPDARAAFVQVIASFDHPLAARLALYWLLDRAPEVRLAAATALLGRANAGRPDADIASCLPIMRRWLPAEPARAMVDAAIRARLRQGGAASPVPAWQVQKAFSTLPDGAGAQSIAVLLRQGRRRAVALLLLKQGHGVKDSFITPCGSAEAQQRLLREIGQQVMLLEIEPARIPDAVARALGDGAAQGVLPAPGLVDLIGIWGGDALSPLPSDARSILAAIGAERALPNGKGEEQEALLHLADVFMEREAHFDSWFEDSAALADALARARGARGQEAAVWRHLESRRDWWARQLAACAATLQAASKKDPSLWRAFAASAQALLDKRPLRRVPVMEHIVMVSLDAAEARAIEAAPAAAAPVPPPRATAPRPEKRGEFARLLNEAGRSEAYVQGYLVALAVCPRLVSLAAWLGPLLGGIEFHDEGKLQRILDLMIIRANRMQQEVADPAEIRSWVAALDDPALRDWAGGFSALVAATQAAWAGGTLNPADRRILRQLGAVAGGGDMDGLRTVLPAWIAARYARRL